MKKIVLALCLVSSLTVNLKAQNQELAPARSENRTHKDLPAVTVEERAKKDAERAEKKLALSSDQKAKWELAALEKARANESLATKMKGSTTPEERKAIHSQMRSNKDKFNTTVSSLLTPEQKTKYEQMKKDRQAQHMHKNKHRGENAPAAPQNNNPE